MGPSSCRSARHDLARCPGLANTWFPVGPRHNQTQARQPLDLRGRPPHPVPDTAVTRSSVGHCQCQTQEPPEHPSDPVLRVLLSPHD